jgi:hypothetical protein
MLEIIALIFLTKHIGNLASNKGLRPGRWKLFTVLAWLAGEFIGAMIGVVLFGIHNLFSVLIMAIAGAFTGYVILKNVLSKQPDIIQDDIDHIGQG